MKWTSLNDLREAYLSFFESKEHLRMPSHSLIPENDKSLLLINSGMAPLKKFFTGEEEPPRHRVTTCQKCVRTGDIDNVGKTSRHGTFFEMMGNFSFGDYFKKDAITWSWEFLTKVLEIPEELLYPSVYVDDDEAFDLWNKMIGIPAEKITRLGKEDNFWEHGSGPCGPCSEIYFDRGEKYGCGSPDCAPGCECDRFVEIWNNVFSQFNNDGHGNYTELVQKNIDTGLGLERLATVMQGVDNLFEVDTIRRILDEVCKVAGITYGHGGETDISVRVITDHTRSAMFMISDGVLPSNEGRGYVLRRLLRRAARHGKLLGIKKAFLADITDVAIGESEGAYPELEAKRDYIKKVISVEEERFDATIDAGLNILSGMMSAAVDKGAKSLSGEDAFKLYDTFGFPLDLTREIAAEKGLSIDEDTFTKMMQEQRKRARDARANISGWSEASKTKLSGIAKTEFTGYGEISTKAKILSIIADEDFADSVSEGECTVILDKTPFYGEGGGQVGDTGVICTDNGRLTVTDTKKSDGIYLHICQVTDGIIAVGDTVTAEVDAVRRNAIRRNHSAAHLIQAALRTVLGNHVEQAGSYVDDERVRFDFTHFAPLTSDEISRVEKLVNENILDAETIMTTETDVESAKKMGAMALFGEKYGKTVRVVKMGDFSCELCGGTHMDNTAKIGLFKITSEASVAAGVRRIEGVTGSGVLALLDAHEALIADAAKTLKANNPSDLASRAASLQSELSEKKREIDVLNSRLAASGLDSVIAGAVQCGKVKLAAVDMGAVTLDEARSMCDKLRDKYPDMVAVLAVHDADKLNFVAACGKDAVKSGAHAGNLLKEVSAVTGGRGGGRPDFAVSGGRDIAKIPDALKVAADILASI